MPALQQARQEVVKALKAAVGKGYSPTVLELETPKQVAWGDIAFPCFNMAKGMKRNPAEIASELAPKIKEGGMIAHVEARGPYINFTLNNEKFAQMVLADVVDETYGANDSMRGKKVMVEYYQPNTHKEVHVGHLRAALVGQEAVNVFAANGAEVLPTTYINDLGLHVAKCLWAIQKFHPGEEPGKGERNAFLGKVYTEASVWLEEHPDDAAEVHKIHQSLEERHRGWISLWKKTRGWSLEVIEAIGKELGLTINRRYFESDLMRRAKMIVDDLLARKIAKVSEGATIVDLEDQKLGVNLLKRTDGTLLYNAKDLALALTKEDDAHPDVSLIVVDVRQSLAMQQLIATLKLMGFPKHVRHMSFDLVTLPTGTMASRKGNVLKYEDVRDELLNVSEFETAKRHPEWKEKQVKDVARRLAFAALKFTILKHDLDKVVTFNVIEALSFDGYTGPYCLYTLARIESIFKKAKKRGGSAATTRFEHPSELALLRKVAEYPDLVHWVGQNETLSSVAEYAFQLAKQFAEFYHVCPVIQAETPELIAVRLDLCRATQVTLENALALLGIEPVKEM
ncbi:MAG: arginine--tRNA ligase [Patescibacteria group bacterium]